MADHSKPTVTSTYANYTSELDGRLDDLALGLDPATTSPTNVPTNAIRWASASNKWQKWNGSAWGDLSGSYSININGTVGATTPAAGSFTSITNTGGTANGVTYLNGSKVLTSGSALTFDGTFLQASAVIRGSNGSNQGAEIGWSAGASYAFVQGYDRTAATFQPLALTGSNLQFLVGSSPSEQMRLTSTGLGIGTSSPTFGGSRGIHIANSSGDSRLHLTDNTTGTTANDGTEIVVNSGNLYIDQKEAQPIIFLVGGSERVRIDSAGSVGIGTSAPVAKLAVVGGTSNASNLATAYSLAAFNITPKSTSGYSLQFGSGPADLPYIQMSAGGAAAGNLLIQPYGGNLGIGTTSPTNGKLEVQTSATTAGLWVQTGGTTSSYTVADFRTGSNAPALVVKGDNKVGINTTSPTQKLTIEGAMNLRNGSRAGAFEIDSSGNLWMGTATTAGNIIFESGHTTTGLPSTGGERARIDSSGNLLVGATSGGGKLTVTGTGSSGWVSNFVNSGTGTIASCVFTNGNGVVGSIQTSGSSTFYNTSSDYRLKEDWQPMTGASERVKALKPVNFAWKVDGSRVDGFLAHEAQAVVPEAVVGEKDAVDAEGKPVYQGIDQSKLVPLLTAALQEALAKIESLTARVSALEGN